MLDTLPETGGKFQLTHYEAHAWLKALNDIRLALGVRLGVTEEFEEQRASSCPPTTRSGPCTRSTPGSAQCRSRWSRR